MYKRSIYLDRIRPFLDKPVIKVIRGMRRVGKSCLLRQVIDLLKDEGVAAERILRIDKESRDFEHIRTYDDLNREVLSAFSGQAAPCYLIVDQVQEIEEWERSSISLAARGDIDILISGSNAHLLSSELATLISGRYIEIPVYSLGFAEHLQFSEQNRTDRQDEFTNFLRMGGMPATYHFERDEELIYQYIDSVYNTILLKDIVKRHSIRNVALGASHLCGDWS